MLQKRRTLELNALYCRRHRERKGNWLADKMSELVEHGYNVILSLCLTFKQPTENNVGMVVSVEQKPRKRIDGPREGRGCLS
jgi:hypothetical protein